MSDRLLPLAQFFSSQAPAEMVIAYHAQHYYSKQKFELSVKYWVEQFQAQAFQNYALYTHDAYPFAILLFALLHAGKRIWLPGNNLSGTAQQLSDSCQLIGNWHAGEEVDFCTQIPSNANLSLAPLNPLAAQLIIFTSGSEGSAKPIRKCLQQFELEVAQLEQYWGEQLGTATALGTVSHQHIYGLLFRVLWPIFAGRCFYSQIFVDPEMLLHAGRRQPAYWIASPAHLKRLDQYSSWEDIADLNVIFSSGGALAEGVAQQILHSARQAVIEIYGSSETGGIAWRQTQKAWTLFSGMRLACSDSRCVLASPYLLNAPESPPGEFNNAVIKWRKGYYPLDDRIMLLDDEHFILQGRMDNIVKIEEKRLSLTELEQKLQTVFGIADAHTLVITKNRDIVAAVLVLNQQGLARLEELGRSRLVKQLRLALAEWFEAVLLPRKWLLVNSIPLTPQGKVAQQLLASLLDADNRKFPQVRSLDINADNVLLGIKVPNDLWCFPEHFASYPLLPGVVQLAWVTHFGNLLFAIHKTFTQMEAIKFIKVIQPGDILTLSLSWNASSGKLYFTFNSDSGVHSSGRMIFTNTDSPEKKND